MTYIAYGPERKLTDQTLHLAMAADTILKEYDGAITLRGLFYQFVARNLLPNTEQSYDGLGRAVSAGRRAGLVSWTAIDDTLRQLQGQTYQDGPLAALKRMRARYLLDKWADQDWRPQVWSEKDAALPTIERTCLELGVDYRACRGYGSDSMLWRAGRQFAQYIREGQRPIVFYLGDHDPSGLDMTRDVTERLEEYCGVPVQVVRLALNRDQVDEHRLPPNPTKLRDSRAADYVARHGRDSWEMDALPPPVVQALVRDAVLSLRDEAKWDAALRTEAEDWQALDDLIATVDGAGG